MRGRGSLQTCALTLGAGMLVAVLSATGNYSFAQTQRAGETGDQTALAVPRVGLRGAAGVALPQPLSPSEAGLARRIFALQDAGSMGEAEKETARLQNDLLLGTILADRYLRPNYRPNVPELAAWLTRFGDQPEAPAIRTLLDRLTPEPATQSVDASPSPARTAKGSARPSQARSLFVQNQDAAVLATGQKLLAGNSLDQGAAEALLVAGLSAVRLGEAESATRFFDTAYHTAAGSPLRAASAFWAGRIAQRRGDRGSFATWMRRAALEGDTFYGLIARRALGLPVACVAGATVGNADVEALLDTPAGRRAFALLQVGEKQYSEMELRTLWVDTAQDGVFDRSLILAARAVGFSRLADEIEQTGPAQHGEPIPVQLRPAGGFVVDPPLVYALVRHESNFQPAAVSHAGARGLMQIMPRTASAVAGGLAAHLQEPAVNLSIGQQYLLVLADDEAIDGDLIRLLASYGQGQGGLRKWVDAVRDEGDPLMFIEAIPNAQTRGFVEDALIYSWHYAAQLHLPATSLDALAAGRYPRLMRAGEGSTPRTAGACTRRTALR